MNASVRHAAAHTLPTPAIPSTLPQRNETERCIRQSEVIHRLVDALLTGFEFTVYEEQVIYHMLAGRSCEAIAWRLGIRSTTVHKHMHRVYAKTGTSERSDLYRLALLLSARWATRTRAAA